MTKRIVAVILSFIICCTFVSCKNTNEPQNDVNEKITQFDEMLTNIVRTMNTDAQNILVKEFKIKYTPSGDLKDAFFNVWIYNGTKINEDFWIEKDIFVASDKTVSFNIINEKIVLLSEYNPKTDGRTQTIDEIMPKIQFSVLQTSNIDKNELRPEYYLLTGYTEKYVEYVANSDSGIEYWQESNTNFIASSKPKDLSPESYYPPDKDYFVIVPLYQKNSIENFVFEEGGNLVSANYKVLLFNK